VPGVVFAFILGDLDLFLFSLYDCSYLVTEKSSCNSISSIIIISAVFYHALVVGIPRMSRLCRSIQSVGWLSISLELQTPPGIFWCRHLQMSDFGQIPVIPAP
jgi:hypothetical protein